MKYITQGDYYGTGVDYSETGGCFIYFDFAGFVCVKTKAVKMEGKKHFGFTLISDCTGNGYQFVYDGI